jgi:hypothetical protein
VNILKSLWFLKVTWTVLERRMAVGSPNLLKVSKLQALERFREVKSLQGLADYLPA